MNTGQQEPRCDKCGEYVMDGRAWTIHHKKCPCPFATTTEKLSPWMDPNHAFGPPASPSPSPHGDAPEVVGGDVDSRFVLVPPPAPTTERAAATPGTFAALGMTFRVDEFQPEGVVTFRDADGNEVGRIVSVSSSPAATPASLVNDPVVCALRTAILGPTPAATPDPTEAGPSWGEIAEKADGYATHMATADGLRSAMRILAENIRCALRRARSGGKDGR